MTFSLKSFFSVDDWGLLVVSERPPVAQLFTEKTCSNIVSFIYRVKEADKTTGAKHFH